MLTKEFKKQLAGDKFAGYKLAERKIYEATSPAVKKVTKRVSKGINKSMYKKMSYKPILKKSQVTLKIQEPRELPADYQSPYMKKEVEQEKRRMFFS